MQRQTTRRTYGTGSLRVKHGSWYGSWRTVDGRRTSRKLGPTATMTEAQAEAELRFEMEDDRKAIEKRRSANARIRYAEARKPADTRLLGVYFIMAAEVGRVKIGKVDSGPGGGVDARLTQLQTGSPVELVLHRFVPFGDPYYLENFLHMRYAGQRMRGEWFDASVLEEIDQLSDRGVIDLLTERIRAA